MKLEEKIKLIWDFRGPNCNKTAKHYQIHLSEFLTNCDTPYFKFGGKELNELHYIVFLVVSKSTMKYFRDKLRPNRGEIA